MTPALLALLVAAPPGGQFWVYLGTYTAKGGSQGIYRSAFDAGTGALGEPQLAAELTSPSFLTLRPDGKVLYAVGETNGKDGGGVFAFAVDRTTGGLTRLNTVPSRGNGPCHVSVDPGGRYAAVANYGGGTSITVRLSADGRLGEVCDFNAHSGSGPDKARQDKSHAHCTAFDPAGKAFFVADLGTDRVYVCGVDKATDPAGKPAFHTWDLPPGSGPRHLALDPAGGLAFVNGELDSTLNVVRYDLAKEEGKVVQSVSTLPGGKPVKGNSTAEVVRHPSGKFVYVSNRGHNSVAAFAWDGKTLTPIGHATEGIKTPRNFNLSPAGDWMLVANQDGDDVCVFKVGADGLPTPTGIRVAVKKPVCVKFLARP